LGDHVLRLYRTVLFLSIVMCTHINCVRKKHGILSFAKTLLCWHQSFISRYVCDSLPTPSTHFVSVRTFLYRSSAVAVIADRTAYDVRYSWNSPGERMIGALCIYLQFQTEV